MLPLIMTIPYQQATTFNGTSDFVDTGVKLFDTDKDFTVFMDFASDQTQSDDQATIAHCMNEQLPFPGLSVRDMHTDSSTNIRVDFFGSNGDIPKTEHNKLVITHTKNSNSIKVYPASNDAGQTISTTAYQSITQNIILGAYQTENGTKGRYWKGTLNKFNVWFKTLTTEEINALFQ